MLKKKGYMLKLKDDVYHIYDELMYSRCKAIYARLEPLLDNEFILKHGGLCQPPFFWNLQDQKVQRYFGSTTLEYYVSLLPSSYSFQAVPTSVGRQGPYGCRVQGTCVSNYAEIEGDGGE
jgi:hypothetical protein